MPVAATLLYGADENGWYAETTTSVTTWATWNNQYYRITYDAATASALTWQAWCSTGTLTDDTWGYWNATASTIVTSASEAWHQWNLTAEEVAERQAKIEAARLEKEQREVERLRLAKEADERAERLLRESLNTQQLAEYEKEQCFTVHSKDGQRRYRIRRGWSHNVERIDETGKRLHTLCAHPIETVPNHDNMLLQKLFLEHDEDTFLQIANKGRPA